jgi:hypothetical protein
MNGYPRLHQAWGQGIQNLPDLTEEEKIAKHDLIWHDPRAFGWQYTIGGLPTDNYRAETVSFFGPAGLSMEVIRGLNPDIKILASVQHYNCLDGRLSEDDTWWLRVQGNRVAVGGDSYKLDQSDLSLQDHVAARAKIVMGTGNFAGIMLDWFNPNNTVVANGTAILRKVRAAIGQEALIIVNANQVKLPLAEIALVNGIFMELKAPNDAASWQLAQKALEYNEKNVRSPRINCLDVHMITDPDDKRLKATMALSLTRSNGYFNFSLPKTANRAGHFHKWWPIYEPPLGQVLGPAVYANGKYTRPFEHGKVVYGVNGTGSIIRT